MCLFYVKSRICTVFSLYAVNTVVVLSLFSGYGTAAGGDCGHLTPPACNAANASKIVTQLCDNVDKCRVRLFTAHFERT